MNSIRLAISTCPNDTFAFHAILNGCIDLRGLDLQIQLLDISELNSGLFAGDFDVAKCSFHAALKLATDYIVLPSGSALGFGNGPLLLASAENTKPGNESQLTLCPGPNTTATLLFKMFYGCSKIEHLVFSEIMPALCKSKADFGVCIHEGRFTYQNSNLFLVEDLGERWERETGFPLPLGGIVARKSLGHETLQRMQTVIRESIEYATNHRDETAESMKKYAQEFNDDILFKHVDLYVNDWTINLGIEGSNAIKRFSELAIDKLNLNASRSLQVLGY